MTNALRHIHPDDTTELLSSYLDDALDVVERRRVDTLLRDCPACAVDLQDLRGLRRLLRELPAPQPTRSFTLDPSAIRPRMRLFPIFRFASLAAALLLFVVLGLDALGGRGEMQAASQTTSAESGPAAQEPNLLRRSGATAAPALPEQPAAGGVMQQATMAAAIAEAPEITPPEESADTAAGALAAPTVAAEAGAADAQPAATIAAAAPPAAAMTSPATTEVAAPAADQMVPTPAAAEEAAATPLDDPAAGFGYVPSNAPTVAGEIVPPEEAVESSSVLTKSESLAPETTTLEEPQVVPDLASRPARVDPWRVAELALAALVVGLGAATWWTARRGL